MHKTTHPCGGTYRPPPPPQQTPPNHKNDVVFSPILQPYDPCSRHHLGAAIPPAPFTVTSVVAAAASSWLRNRRIRYLFLLLCSPLLLVLLCAALPFLCAADLCFRRRIWRKLLRDFSGEDSGDRLRRCEEGCLDEENEEKGLLHRYLEDQLLLVRSMYECGDDEEEQEEHEEEDSRRVEDVENIGSSSKTPLLLR